MPNTYVIWTTLEKKAIVEFILDRRDKHPELPLVQLIRIGQEAVLPASRQRNITSIQCVEKWLMPMLNENRSDTNKSDIITETCENQVFNKSLATLQNDSESILREILLELRKFTPHDIIGTTAKKVVTLLMPQIEALIAGMLLNPQNRAITVKPEREKDLDNILLINLKSIQVQEVEAACASYYNIVSWSDGEDSYDRLKSLCKSAHRIYIPTKFCSHKVTTIIKNINPTGYTPFVGATTTLIHMLERLYCES